MPKVFVAKETRPGENRVAATPETVKKMAKAGLAVGVESGAGTAAGFLDKQYAEAGAEVGAGGAAAWQGADVVLKVAAPTDGEVSQLRSGAILAALLDPYRNPELAVRLAAQGVSAFALELVPRITRAQAMDALSSQASIAGYKAVLLAALAPRQVLPAADDRRRHHPAGAGGDAWAPASPACRRSPPPSGWARWSRCRTSAPRSRSRSSRWAASSSSCRSRRAARAQGGYAKEMTPSSWRSSARLLTQRIAPPTW